MFCWPKQSPFIEQLLWIRHHSTNTFSHLIGSIKQKGEPAHSHFADKETGAQRAQTTCLKAAQLLRCENFNGSPICWTPKSVFLAYHHVFQHLLCCSFEFSCVGLLFFLNFFRHFMFYTLIYFVFTEYPPWERHYRYFKKSKTLFLPLLSLWPLQGPFYNSLLLPMLTLLQPVIHIAAWVIFLNGKSQHGTDPCLKYSMASCRT